MQKNNTDFYRDIVLDLVPQGTQIFAPQTQGTMSYVLVANTEPEKTVFKFSKSPTDHRTEYISEILTAYQIPVPKIDTIIKHGLTIEKYPYMPGKTMHEYMNTGITDSERDIIYSDILNLIEKIGAIPKSEFDKIPNKACHQVSESNIVHKTNNPTIGRIVRYATQILNTGPQTICHCDISTKNILLDTNKRVCALLDLNAVSICNINFAMALTGNNLTKANLDPTIFYRIASTKFTTKLNNPRIRALQQIFGIYLSQYGKIRENR